jgi:YbbR domain-containing protein
MAWHPFRNVGLKAAALGLGTLLWLTVTGHQIERRLYVPVSYSNVPEPLELTGDQIDLVSVTVRGDDNRVSTLREGDIRVLVSLEHAQPGTNVIPLRPEDVLAPLGVEALQVDPSTANVTLERSNQRRVTVQPTVEGQLMAGMIVERIVVEPAAVTVEGPESRLEGPIGLITQPIVLTGRGGTFSEDVEVGVSDAQLRVLQPRTVRVTVHVVPAHR